MTVSKAIFVALALSVLWAGCSTEHYRLSADRETTAIIHAKGARVPNMELPFSIAATGVVSLTGCPLNTNVAAFMGADAAEEQGVPIVSLEQALQIAVRHSRAYQNAKENVYLSALSLTLSRHRFTPIFSGNGNAEYAEVNDPVVNSRQFSAGGSVGVDWLIRDIGKMTTAFTTDFLRFLMGDPRSVIASQLGATFTRPLLRNAGFKADTEALTQAERDVLYDIRSFVRFRKNFSVEVATAYYGVLGNRDAIRNSYLNLESSRRAAERSRALAQEGRATQSDLGRLEQQVLSAESSWINAVRTYKRALDEFKILLGIPVETRLMLDDRELEQLRINHPNLSVSDCVRVALAARLDYQNLQDQIADAQRKVALAADRFKPQLDLSASVAIHSGEQGHFTLPDARRYNWNAGVDLDLPFDRKAERNSYRAALIAHERALRAVEQRRDEIILQVRESYRSLEQARRTYEISEIGVKLAERRVEEQNLLAELGKAKAQDQVDAQNDLVNSKNQRTQALVAHTIARLQFWNNMGILYIKDNGQWREMNDAEVK